MKDDDTPHFDPEDTEVTGDEDEAVDLDAPFVADMSAGLLGEMSQGPLAFGPKGPEAGMPYVEEPPYVGEPFYVEDNRRATQGGSDDETEDDPKPKPPVSFNFRDFPDVSDHPLIHMLETWTEWLVWHFELGEIIPSCWPQHPAIAEELAGLFESWDVIYVGPNSSKSAFDQLTWLSQLEVSLRRIHERWDRSDCGSSGAHPGERVRSVWPGMTGNPEDKDHVFGLTQFGHEGPTPAEKDAARRASEVAARALSHLDLGDLESEDPAAARLLASMRRLDSTPSVDPFANPDLVDNPDRYKEPF